MKLHYQSDSIKLFSGECLEVLRSLPDNSIDSIVTDPPYGLSNTSTEHVVDALTQWVSGNTEYVPHAKGGFMGKTWDAFVPPPAVWAECLRVLKPGGFLLTFSGSRTIGLMEMSVRLAGFTIKDSIAWLYGTGFPKGQDIGKVIDKAERGIPQGTADPLSPNHGKYETQSAEDKRSVTDQEQSSETVASTFLTPDKEYEKGDIENLNFSENAQKWVGWNNALKPAFEPIIVAQKPFNGPLYKNIQIYGTGAFNIDATRIHTDDKLNGGRTTGSVKATNDGWNRPFMDNPDEVARISLESGLRVAKAESLGRYTPNVALDETQASELDNQSGVTKSSGGSGSTSGKTGQTVYDNYSGDNVGENAGGLGDTGGASRFFYIAKAPKSERPTIDGISHPTVKPLTLIQHLIKLVTPKDGIILDPFVGSGTTIEASIKENFNVIGIEREKEYLPLIMKRINKKF